MPATARRKDSCKTNPKKINKMPTATPVSLPNEKDVNAKSSMTTTQIDMNDASATTVAGTLSHETTTSGEALPLSRSAGSTEQLPLVSEAEPQQQQNKPLVPGITLPQPIPDVTSPTHMIISREWKTEIQSEESVQPPASMIPEKDAVLWLIKDFAAFRSAAKVSQIPPLVSPEFGGGCRLRLWLYEKKGHILGSVELPLVKATRDGVAHFRVSVVRPDLKSITLKKVEMRINCGGADKKIVLQQRSSPPFMLTRPRCLRSPRYDRLIYDDCLRVRVEFEYFPFDAPVFRGFGRSLLNSDKHGEYENNYDSPNRMAASELLHDIRQYCQEDPSQNVEIRRDEIVFNACRFLLCARSKRFREIFGNTVSTARGSPSRLGPFSRTAATPGTSLSSITIQDIPAETLDQILNFIHSDSCQWIDDRSTDVLKVLDLLEGSDLYGIESLTRLLIIYLADRMDNDNFMFMYDVSERIHSPDLRRICTQFMDSLPGSQVASLMRANSCFPSPRAA